MGIAAKLNTQGLALSLLESAANGLQVTSILFKPSTLLHKGSDVRVTATSLGVIAALLRFTLVVYPLLPGGVNGSHSNATFTLIGAQLAACPACAELTTYVRIVQSITAVGNATFTGNFTQKGDALIIPPFVDNSSGPLIEKEQDTLKLMSCQHTSGTKPGAHVGDMEYTTKEYGRTVFGLTGGIFKFSMAFGEDQPYPYQSYYTMECQAQLMRYKYIQDILYGGPIQIIHKLNTSALPVYNLSWPGFVDYVYSTNLQLEYINDDSVGTKDFIAIMVSMLSGLSPTDNILVTSGRPAGQFRLDASAVTLLTATSVAVWIISAGLLITYTYSADCIATSADGGLLNAARGGPELDQLLHGGCNGKIPTSSAQTIVLA